MTEISVQSVEEFLRRFGTPDCGNFHDAVVRRIEVRYTPGRPGISVSLEISVQDAESEASAGWVNVRFDVDGVVQFVLKEGPRTTCVVVFCLDVRFLDDGKVSLDFSAVERSAGVTGEHAESDFLVVGERCYWALLPYAESPD